MFIRNDAFTRKDSLLINFQALVVTVPVSA